MLATFFESLWKNWFLWHRVSQMDWSENVLLLVNEIARERERRCPFVSESGCECVWVCVNVFMMFCECLKEFISICLSPIVWTVTLWQWVRVWAGEKVFSLMWGQVLVWKQAYIRVSAFSRMYVCIFLQLACVSVCVCVRVYGCVRVWVYGCVRLRMGAWAHVHSEEGNVFTKGRKEEVTDWAISSFAFFPSFAKKK